MPPYDPRMPGKPSVRRLLVLIVLLLGEAVWAESVLVVCPEELRPAMASWRRFREAEGRRIEYISQVDRPHISRRPDERRVLLLVGDGERVGPSPGSAPATVIRRYGPESEIATDLTLQERYHADSVARLPFNDPRSLARYLDRVIRRERRVADWGDTRVQIAAGVGGFSPMIDAAIEGSARRLLEGLAPLDAEVSLRRGDAIWREADNSTRGGVWVWLGHGLRDRLPGAPADGLSKATRGADVAVLVACYAGDFAAPGRCVAERLLDAPGGPLVVIGSTRVSMPYGNARLAGELLRGLGESNAAPLGDVLATARRRSLTESDSPLLASLDPIARLLGAEPELLTRERRDHALMYSLLGDPLIRVRRTTPHSAATSEVTVTDGEFVVRGWADSPGELRVELNRDRFALGDRERRSVTGLWKIDAPGAYRVALQTPSDWRPGEATVRVGLRSADGLALNATTTRVERPNVVAERPTVVR